MGRALFLNLCHPDDLAKISVHFEALTKLDDGEVVTLEYRMRHKDGNWVWLLGYDTVFERNETGEVIRHLGTATDITNQKIAQEQAEAERRAADLANDELRSFAYSMSHDMKAPSNTLHMLLQELQDEHGESLDSDAQELLSMSLNTLVKMRSMINDVVNYTRVIGVSPEFADVDLNELIDKIVNNQKRDTHKQVQFLITDLPTVKGSRIQLEILFQNLLANAQKYHLTDASPVVAVSGVLQDETAYIHVKDNGIGIAPEHHSRIFDLFKRLHVNDDYTGSGIGLTTCKRIAFTHGGEISVESALNQGATFTVSLKV